MSFRQQPKRTLSAQVPEEIEERIRRESGGLGKRTIAEVTTEVLCLGLNIDPRKFGIEPSLKSSPKLPIRKPARAAV